MTNTDYCDKLIKSLLDMRCEFNTEGFPSGQRGQTVNLLLLASMVRIHLPPPIQQEPPKFGGSCFCLHVLSHFIHLPPPIRALKIKALLLCKYNVYYLKTCCAALLLFPYRKSDIYSHPTISFIVSNNSFSTKHTSRMPEKGKPDSYTK